MAVQSTQEKSPGTAEKMSATGQPTTAVEKKPSTDAKAAARQPAYTTAMNGSVPPGLTGTTALTAAQYAKPATIAPEAIREPEPDQVGGPEGTAAPEISSPEVPPSPSATKGPAGQPARPKVRTPASDPRFQKVMARLNKSAATTKKHPPAAKKVAEAHAATRPPENERMSKAKAKQVAVMQGAEAKKPEPESFLDLVLKAIKAIMPKDVQGSKNFMKGEQKEQLRGTLQGNLNTQKAEATGDLKAATTQQLDANQVPGEQPTPLPKETDVHPPEVGAADAIPEPKDESEVSQQQGKQEANDKLKDAQVTPEQLKAAHDSRFTDVLNTKTAVEKYADTAPQQYRTDEQKLLTQETAKAAGDEKQGLATLHMVHNQSGLAVRGSQAAAQAKNEARRKEVSDHIEGIYDTTKQNVDKKLNSLDDEVSKTFDQGVAASMQHMADYVNKSLDERYGGILGFFTKLDETLGLLPDEATNIYNAGHDLFLREMDALIRSIATVVETRLKEAKDEITKGQQEIHTYVDGLDPAWKAVGKAAEQEIAGRFDELRHGVDEKKNELAQKLAQRYKDASEKADERLKQIQEEHKGLLDTFFDKLAAVVKILGEFRDRITNMLKTGRDTILLIVAHPIDFLKNLINAIKQGVNQFVDNIWTHLKAGFMAWLFGTLENAGIQIPKDFSLGSILKLVLQILGLTYERIHAKAVKLIGERNMAIIEKVGQVIYTLITSGPEALWEQIKEFLGNLKGMVVDAIQNWVVTTVIKNAVIKLLALFIPVSAIMEAIEGIYHTVTFFIERINQILTFVESIINSVHKIAVGDIADAANWIEKALAKTIPLIIGFLAELLNLGDLSEKIKEIIAKIQKFVDEAIDKLLDKIVKGIGKLFGKGKDEKPGNVREKAQKELAQRLKDEHTEEEARGIIKEVFTELQPEGLKRLELGSETADGEYPIMIEASPEEELMKLKPKSVKGKKVVMTVKLTLKDEDKEAVFSDFSRIPGTSRAKTEHYKEGKLVESTELAYLEPLEGITAAPKGTSAGQREEHFKLGGVIVKPETGSKEFHMATWSTGEWVEGTNESHAERQFFEWFKKQLPSWRKRVKRVDMEISESPCSLCVTTLCELKGMLDENNAITLTYTELHEGANPTTEDDLAKLDGCIGKEKVHGPRKVEKPKKKLVEK